MEKITLEANKKMVGSTDAAFSFLGIIDIDFVDHVLASTHAKLETFEANPGVRRKVYLVLVECLQNLCKQVENLNQDERHSGEYDKSSASFIIKTDAKGYYIATANFVANDKVESLSNWLNEINCYTREELRSVYNKILTNKSYSKQGGAGLGFVDILLKTNNKLEFTFEVVDDNYSFFSINVCVEK